MPQIFRDVGKIRQFEGGVHPGRMRTTQRQITETDRLKGMHIVLSNNQAGPVRTLKQEQEDISRNHVQAF